MRWKMMMTFLKNLGQHVRLAKTDGFLIFGYVEVMSQKGMLIRSSTATSYISRSAIETLIPLDG